MHSSVAGCRGSRELPEQELVRQAWGISRLLSFGVRAPEPPPEPSEGLTRQSPRGLPDRIVACR